MENKNIALFVTGGIAAYKVPLLVRGLIKSGHTVRVAMTQAATHFVTPDTLAILTKHPVLTDGSEFTAPEHVAHVELAKWADIAVVVPATANTIAKLANGIADNVVSTTLLAFHGPLFVVPAMNDQMWANPATQHNLTTLTAFGVHILQPATGFLAEGYVGKGRMPEPDIIQRFIEATPEHPFLAGRHVLISAGGTRERLDPVRYLTNDSSGKMGTALANVALAAGAQVTLVTTAHQPVLPGIDVVAVSSAAEMADAMTAHYADADIVVMAAAVADFRPQAVADNKIKKQDSEMQLTLQLEQNPDILAQLGAAKTHQFLVGFAAETQDLLHYATQKLHKKHADMIVANQVGQATTGFNAETNAVTLLRPDQEPQPLELATKTAIAAQILMMIEQELEARGD